MRKRALYKLFWQFVIIAGIILFLLCSFAIPYLGFTDRDFGFWRFMAMISGASFGVSMIMVGIESIEGENSFSRGSETRVKLYRES